MTLAVARQMLAAEILKLRRNRALLAFAGLLSVGAVALYFGYNAVEHAGDPRGYLPAGGTHGLTRAVRTLGLLFGALTAMLVGTEAGTADLSTGVFRDLVATGRSRLVLFAVRAPAAIVVTVAFNALGLALTLAATFALAGPLPTPSVAVILEAAAWILLANAVIAALAVAVGSMCGSRTLTLTAVIGWQTFATQLLLNVSSLKGARDGLLSAALGQLMPVGTNLGITMSTGIAVAVLAAWLVIPAAAGAWATHRRDA